jgi:hypothetical protein
MRRWWRVVSLVAVATMMLPASASAAGPHVEDPCGDADVMVWAGGTTVPTPDAERASGFDVRSVTFADLPAGGVEVALQLCGEVPDPELAGSGWSVRWNISVDCQRVLSMVDGVDLMAPEAGIERRVQLSEQCSRPSDSPLGGTVAEITWIEILDVSVATVDADTITWSLTRDMVPAERADSVAFLDAGTVWSAPQAIARDGRWLTEASMGGTAGVHGPGAYDSTAAGRDFTVGA